MVNLILQIAPDPSLLEWLGRASGPAVLAFGIIAFLKGWIVPGSVYKQEREEKQKALDLVYKQAEIVQRTIEVAEARKL